MKHLLPFTLAAALCAGAALADPYVDYTPKKGAWHYTIVKVDPNHVDDYLIAMRKTWLPGEEIAKKRGLIDDYGIQVKMNAADGSGNVMFIEHIPNLGLLEPDKDRDTAMQKDVYAVTSKEKMDAQLKDVDKYRTFVADEYWTDIEFPK
jgi:hypothetical protein